MSVSLLSHTQQLLEFLEPYAPSDTAYNVETSEVVEGVLSALERICVDNPDARRMVLDNDGAATLVAAVGNAHDGPCYYKAMLLVVALARGAPAKDVSCGIEQV